MDGGSIRNLAIELHIIDFLGDFREMKRLSFML